MQPADACRTRRISANRHAAVEGHALTSQTTTHFIGFAQPVARGWGCAATRLLPGDRRNTGTPGHPFDAPATRSVLTLTGVVSGMGADRPAEVSVPFISGLAADAGAQSPHAQGARLFTAMRPRPARNCHTRTHSGGSAPCLASMMAGHGPPAPRASHPRLDCHLNQL